MSLFCLCRVVSSLQFAAATYLPVSDVGLGMIRTAPRPRPPALGCAQAGLLAQFVVNEGHMKWMWFSRCFTVISPNLTPFAAFFQHCFLEVLQCPRF